MGVGAVAEQRALVGGGKESVTPHACAADGGAAAVAHHDEAGQILVLAAQTVGDPCAHRSAARKLMLPVSV